MAADRPAKRDWVPLWLTVLMIGAVGAAFLANSFRTDGAGPRRTLFDLIQPVALANCRLERFGEANDGGYLACANLLDGVGAAYSYGISGYDGWGCDMSTKLRVPVHQYDCFNTTEPVCTSGNTVFHAECVADVAKTENGRPFATVEDQIARNGDAGKHLVVKMDVEGAEWDSLLHAPDATLDAIDQLVVEFHYVHEDRFVKVLRRLRQFFHVAHLHYNNISCMEGLDPFPTWAYEVLFVSKRIATVDEKRSVALPHLLDAPNDPALPPCQPAGK